MPLSSFVMTNGLRRRRGDEVDDPFSDAARFPTLVQDQRADLADAAQQMRDRSIFGKNSAAGRFDQLSTGSIFSRQFGGLADTLRDQQRAADPSNNYYNGQDQNPANGTLGLRRDEMSASERYGETMGYRPLGDVGLRRRRRAFDYDEG